MKGQKITLAMLIYNIQLVDSYNYVSKSILVLTSIIGIEDIAKGDFSHHVHFNQPKFQCYHGLIPAFEWYDADTKSTNRARLQ